MQGEDLLLLMILIPLVGAALTLLSGRLGISQVRWTALSAALVTFALGVGLAVQYEPGRIELPSSGVVQTAGRAAGAPGGNPAAGKVAAKSAESLQFSTNLNWVATRRMVSLEEKSSRKPFLETLGPDVRFAIAVDGISLWLIVLAALLMIPAVLVSWESIQDRPATFYALLLLLEAGMVGVFAAQDIILFYVFFEFTLIPLFFIIGIWGGTQRRWAARKFFIYTLAGSLLTFLGLLFIVLSHAWMTNSPSLTFSIPVLTAEIPAAVEVNSTAALFWAKASPWIFLALFAGFAIKVPLFPFHTWLPLAHVEAPTAGSVLLAGVLLKIGSYGFLRFALPLVPGACWWAFHVISVLAVIGIIYGALLALAQEDIKKLVAYSSVSHMGFCLLGLFAFNTVGISGGLLQMVNHGLSTGALFALVGMLYERYHTRDIEAYSGMTRKFPVMSFCLLVVVFSSIGLPGLNGFTGEILALMGMFQQYALYAILSLSGIILGAWYMLWLVQRTFFGKLREPLLHEHGTAEVAHHEPARDLNFRELAALAPLLAAIFAIGLFPNFFLSRMEPSIRPIAALLQENRPQERPRYSGVSPATQRGPALVVAVPPARPRSATTPVNSEIPGKP